jgi:DNA invertase Pin-like site-specific DNA recombinase
MAMKYGYARVSSSTQDHNGQVEALKAAGCERIYSEKASGKSTNGRPEFEKIMRVILPGDTVVVTKLDRLARSSRDLHKTSCTNFNSDPVASYRLVRAGATPRPMSAV